jgi:DNA-binding transcriptional ArsR family regulator
MAAGELPVNDLVRALRRRGTSLAVTRASLSRTLRRLWRAGLVELATRYSYMPTMTEKQQRDRARVDADITDPVAAYERYKSVVGSEFDTCGSPEAYLAGLRANWGRAPDLRVQRVRITDAGRCCTTGSR